MATQRQKLNNGFDGFDGFNVWIKQVLKDNLTGAEFDKLAKNAQDLSKDFLQNHPLEVIALSVFKQTSKPSKSNISEKDKQELSSLEQKAREILIEEARNLVFDDFKKLLQCAHINQNTGKKNTNQNTSENTMLWASNETDKKAESKEESSENIEYKIGGKLLEVLRQNLTGRDFREFSECVENDTPNYDLFDKAKEILIKCLESYPILITIKQRGFCGVSIGDSLNKMFSK